MLCQLEKKRKKHSSNAVHLKRKVAVREGHLPQLQHDNVEFVPRKEPVARQPGSGLPGELLPTAALSAAQGQSLQLDLGERNKIHGLVREKQNSSRYFGKLQEVASSHRSTIFLGYGLKEKRINFFQYAMFSRSFHGLYRYTCPTNGRNFFPHTEHCCFMSRNAFHPTAWT